MSVAVTPLTTHRWPAVVQTLVGNRAGKISALRAIPTQLEGPVLIEPTLHADDRGFFAETWRADLQKQLGFGDDVIFVQDNHSRSSRGVVRGMHFQVGRGIHKLVRCAYGSIFDVIVDLRRGSPTYARWEGFELTGENMRQLFVPIGFAHGFCVTSDTAVAVYRQTGFYDSELEQGISFEDPDIAIAWPEGLELLPSPRDAAAPTLAVVADKLPFTWSA